MARESGVSYGVRSLLAALALIATPFSNADAEWTVKKFEVFAGAPYQRDDGVVEFIGYDWVEAEDWFPGFNKTEIERAFNQAAEWYSKQGFPEPMLEPIVDSGNGPAYRIYVCTEAWWLSLQASAFAQEFISLFKGPHPHIDRWSNCGTSLGQNSSDWAAYNGRCAVKHGARPVMFINANGPVFDDGKLTAQGYNTVAHELMHAIQANSVQGKSPDPCEIGDWIGEGQADAVSMDMIEQIPTWSTVAQPTSDYWISKNWGIRPYSENIATDPSGYPVSSFWRFLADINRGYDYLVTGKDGSPGVMDFEIEKAGNWQSELMWLDLGLYVKFNKRFNELLGLFMNHFSIRIPRMTWTSGNMSVDWPRWVKAIWGECEQISLSDRNPSQIFSRNIAPGGGDCAWLTVNVQQATVQVNVQAEANDVAIFKDIWIGMPEGDTVLTDAMVAGTSPTDPSKFVGIWANFTVTTGFPTLLMFTNLADDPEKTKRRPQIFEISMNSSTNSLRGNAPAGPGAAAQPAARPVYDKKHADPLPKKTAATTAMVTEQKNLDKKALSPHTTLSTTAKLQPDAPPCNDPFKYQPCGPSTSISMALMPGTWGNLGHSAGAGGAAAQIFSSMMGQALSNPFDSTEVMVNLDEKLKSIDAAEVSISMPFMDYGQTGSVDNALIRATVGGIPMESVGPPDANGQTPLTGTVSIEVFTPFALRGTYSAPLAYFEESPSPDQPPVYRRGPTLTGTFNQVAPWLSDDRVERIQLQSEAEIADDVGSALGIPASTMRAMREDGTIPGGNASPGTSSAGGGSPSGGTLGGDCDCACANKGKVDDLCEFFCEEEFAACP